MDGSRWALLVGLMGVLGLVIGSFANVVVYRVPRGQSVLHPPSRCPSCHRRLSPAENLPLVSWVLLRGRCRRCRAPIPLRYPLVEAATAAAFALFTGFVSHTWQLAPLLALSAAVVVSAAVDVDRFPQPRSVVAALAAAVVANGALSVDLGQHVALARAAIFAAAVGLAGVATRWPGPPSAGSEQTPSAERRGAVVLTALGWFAGWLSVAGGAGVTIVGVAALVASRRSSGHRRPPLWLPVVVGAALLLAAAGLRSP